MSLSQLRDEPLGNLLNLKQCIELTQVVAKTTERMRSAIFDTFNASRSSSAAPWEKGSLNSQGVKSENPNLKTDTSTTSAAKRESARRQLQHQEELSAPRMQEFKAAALKHFDQWRDSVLLRFGEIVSSHQEASQQAPRLVSSNPERAASSSHPKPQTPHGTQAQAELTKLYPPITTSLVSLPHETSTLVLHSVLLLLLSLEHYTSYSRILLLRLASSLHVPPYTLSVSEVKTARGLLEAAKALSADAEAAVRAKSSESSRRWKVGLASVAGAAIIGVTGGLAAPLVAAGIGGVLGGVGLGGTVVAGLLGTLTGSGVLVGSLFGAYGGRMTGQMMDAYAKEVSDFAFLPIREGNGSEEARQKNRRLRLTIGISGWLETGAEVVNPWRVIGGATELFALRWELDCLLDLGSALETMVMSYGMSFITIEILKRTVLASLWAALWPFSLLQFARIVDNPFSVAKSRSEKAGEVLADALINKAQGERPVTLIGYSLGARVIYSCLMSLAERRAFGIIENVILLGSPIPSTTDEWRVMRTVVTGRLVNVYSENDYILAFLYRTSSIQKGVAGLQKITVHGVENVDVTEQVSGHLRYKHLVGSILQRIGWGDLHMGEVRREEQALKLIEEKEDALKKEQEEAGVDLDRVAKEAAVGAKIGGRQADWEELKREARKEAVESMEKDANDFKATHVDRDEKLLGEMSEWDIVREHAKREALRSMEMNPEEPLIDFGQVTPESSSKQEKKEPVQTSMLLQDAGYDQRRAGQVIRQEHPAERKEPVKATMIESSLEGARSDQDVEEVIEMMHVGPWAMHDDSD